MAIPRWRALRTGLFGSPLNAAITLACVVVLAWEVPPLVRWTLVDAVWHGPAERCSEAAGACWAFVGEKLRYILFGLYDPDRQWRPAAATVVLLALMALSALPRFWRRGTLALWGAGLATIVRTLAIGFIELTRGVPLIAVLYVATLLSPLMLPAGAAVGKLLRAQVAIVLFVAAYQAEIIRAGLQAVPRGQVEAARALGLGWWGTMRLVVLPQARRTGVPAMVNLGIGVFQDTTLIIVIGLFDILNTARTAAKDPAWLGFYDEAFGFAAVVYLVVCVTASRYSLWLERRLRGG